MSLLTLVLIIAGVGFCTWLVLQLDMPPPFPRILVGVVCLFMILFILQSFGLTGTHLRLK
jgi:hypothetical protein